MPSKDPRDMTIRELGELAELIRTQPTGTKRYRQAADRMCAASLYLEDSGALGQFIWWAKDTMMQAPPDAKGKLLLMPSAQTELGN
jgi:hypothetical protein